LFCVEVSWRWWRQWRFNRLGQWFRQWHR